MAYQAIFKRYEQKYLLSKEQKQKLLSAMEPYMALDKYGRTIIRNIYFDTDDYRLIRHSIEGPQYKEKLRVRSYCKANEATTVFVELKKKYEKVVYKRRIAMPRKDATRWLLDGGKRLDSQIAREIEYFLQYYKGIHPAVYLSYEREAYYSKDKSDFRVTLDENILCRENELSLNSEPYGISLLPEGTTLMEIKCSGAIPLWMIDVLSEEHIYKTSFSKYGTAYKKIIYPRKKKEVVGCA